jgi:hypothetical protein
MRTITIVAVIAVLLLGYGGMIPRSSVDGPLILILMFLVAALAAGAHEAWSQRRSAAGSLVSILAAVAGGILGIALGGVYVETVLAWLDLGDPLASSASPLLYAFAATLVLLGMLGVWLALRLVNRVR